MHCINMCVLLPVCPPQHIAFYFPIFHEQGILLHPLSRPLFLLLRLLLHPCLLFHQFSFSIVSFSLFLSSQNNPKEWRGLSKATLSLSLSHFLSLSPPSCCREAAQFSPRQNGPFSVNGRRSTVSVENNWKGIVCRYPTFDILPEEWNGKGKKIVETVLMILLHIQNEIFTHFLFYTPIAPVSLVLLGK